MQIEFIKITELVPYEKNPRINKNAVDAVANSMREFGVKTPLVIDDNNVLVCGHTRLKAAKKLKLKELPCVRASDLTEEQLKAYRIADNSSAALAEWDLDLLAVEVGEISLDMSEFGLDMNMLSGEEQKQDDYSEKEISAFEIIVSCESEIELEEVYNELIERGLQCKISTL